MVSRLLKIRISWSNKVMIHEESVLLLHSLQTTHSLISTRKIGKRDLRNIHTLLHLYHIQFLWICSHSLPMGKVIVWPTDFFTILSEKWNLSIFSLKSCFQYAYMLGCPFSSTSYWTCINIFLQKPFCPFHYILNMNSSNEWQS